MDGPFLHESGSPRVEVKDVEDVRLFGLFMRQPCRCADRPAASVHGTVVGMPIVTLDHVSIAYGHLPLLDDVALQVEPRERVSLIGRNGSGKSTLLRTIHGDMPPDAGSIWRQPGLRVARLEQDVPLSAARPVFDVVADGLGGSEGEQHWRVDRVLSHLGLSPDPMSTRSREESSGVCCWRGRWSRSPTCCCSTNRPITWTSPPSRGWKGSWSTTRAP